MYLISTTKNSHNLQGLWIILNDVKMPFLKMRKCEQKPKYGWQLSLTQASESAGLILQTLIDQKCRMRSSLSEPPRLCQEGAFHSKNDF